MNKVLTNLIVCLGILIAIPQMTGAQWVQTNGPCGSPITTLTASGSNLFAGTDTNGVFISTNNGATWKPVNRGWPSNTSIWSIAVNGNTVFAGTMNGVFRSTDTSTSWSAINSGLPSNPGIGSLALSGSTIFAAFSAGSPPFGIFRSIDSGNTWSLIKECQVKSLAVVGSNIIASINGGMFLSRDNGNTFASVKGPSSDWFTVSGGSIYGGTIDYLDTNNGVYLSTDSGETWSLFNKGIGSDWVRALTVLGNSIFIGSWSGVSLSTNNGKSWTRINAGLTDSNITSFTTIGGNVFTGTRDGVFLSSNNGATWTTVNSGLPTTWNALIYSMAASGPQIYAGTDKGIFLSTDNGTNWIPVDSGIPVNTSTLSLVASNNAIFAGTNNSGVYLSIDSGKFWTAANSGLPTKISVQALIVSGSAILAGTNGKGVFRSTNNGASWSAANTGLTDSVINTFTMGGTNVFAGSNRGGIYLSTNNGVSWSVATPILVSGPFGPGITPIISLLANGTDLFAGCSGGGGIMYYGGGVYRSTNNGATWTEVGIFNQIVSCLALCGTNIVAGAQWLHPIIPSSVYISSNGGTSWSDFSSGLTNYFDVRSFLASNSYLFAGGRGIWRRPLSSVAVQRTIKNSKDRIALKISSPNRLNANVSISIFLPRPEKATVKMYSLSGQEIATLVDKNLGSGTHSFSWDTRNIITGCYTVRIQAGTNTYVKSIPIFR
jgi:hypothetical protein